MQMLWIGCLESEEEFKVKASKGYDLASAQVSQKNLITGLEQEGNFTFDSINGSVLPPYPIYEDKIIEPVEWSHSEGAFDISVGYKNYRYVNRLNSKNAMICQAEKWINDRYKGGGVCAFVYSMRSAPMATACFIKKRIPQAKIYLIVTDLPQYMDLGQSKIKALLKKVDWISISRMKEKMDGFILYASQMARFLDIPNDKWMLMEGSYDIKETHEKSKHSGIKSVMYSGKLDNQYGIPMLIDAFRLIKDDNVELWITGGGNAEGYVRQAAAKDKRIKFYGFLPSREAVIDLQNQASLLVNMRLPSEEASNYCFPSKLFEYMATGVPVVSFKLGGIPEEYLQHLCIVEDESETCLMQTLEKWLNYDANMLTERGNKAKEFICEYKNLNAQCKRIIEFIS